MTSDETWESIDGCPTMTAAESRLAGLAVVLKYTCQLFAPPIEGMSRMQSMKKPEVRPRTAVNFIAVTIFLAVLPLAGLAPSQATKPKAQNATKKLLPAMKTKVAFPNFHFDRPVALATPLDGTNLVFVVEQHTATIWSFPNERTTADKKLFLQLPDPIHKGNEEGLLGLAFHPKYKENKQFFVYYSANDKGSRRSVVSRFRATSSDPRVAEPASEERIWVSAEDPFENHNGGTIAFGPDGYLYITLGDGGAADDPLNSGQNPRDWFASILRIDVDHPAAGKLYGIPADNPARRERKFAGWAPEVYCIGLRNVWKFSFDQQDRRTLGGRCRPEPMGDGSQNRERRQLWLEHPRSVSSVPTPNAPAARCGRQDPAADCRVSPRRRPRTAQTAV